MQSSHAGFKQPSPNSDHGFPAVQPTPITPSNDVRSNGVASSAAVCTARPSIEELADPNKYFRRKVDVSNYSAYS